MKTPLQSKTRVALALAAMLCAAQAVAVTLPATTAGTLDPTFNGGAPLLRSFGTGVHNPETVSVDRDGRIVITARRGNSASKGDLSYVTRHLPDGTPDPDFAGGGAPTFGDATTDVEVVGAAIGADRGVWLAGLASQGATLNSVYHPWLARLDAQGNPVPGFGTGGQRMLDCGAATDCEYAAIVTLADGRVAVAGWQYDDTTKAGATFVDVFLPDGLPDPAFGNTGRAVIPAFAGFYASRMTVDASGRLVIAGTREVSATTNQLAVIRLQADGAADATFGSGGEADYLIQDRLNLVGAIAVQADGKLALGSYTFIMGGSQADYAGRIVRFNSDGSLDTGFGTQGLVTLPIFGSGFGLQKDGRMVYAGQTWEAASRSYRAAVMRLLPSGAIDTSYGAGGIVHPFDAGNATVRSATVAPDDAVLVTSSAYLYSKSTQSSYLLMRLIGVETTTAVVEFHNMDLNHYFITADPNEAAAIDSGAAGPGWSRTGQNWKSGGPSRVCRFYGSPVIDPATGMRRGPNGHFYTISQDECAAVKQDAGWQFESYDFSGWPKQADGTCAAGTVAVKRAYNNGYAQNNSNHRYATSDAVYQQMLNEGWSGEGTVFCAPQ